MELVTQALENMIMETPCSLSHFLHISDMDYRKSLSTLSLFDPLQTSLWSNEQKKAFSAIFYHVRGHFINFVWYIANFSIDEHTKNILMKNIHEEIGVGSRLSHEVLYERFAEECGSNIQEEIIKESHYLPFAKEFNKTHLEWLSEHDNDDRLAAFAAYERLDNLDYPPLSAMAKSLNLSARATAFFNVHVHVEHFDSTLELILPIWEKNPEKIITAFHFIYSHQQQMWNNLSETILQWGRT